ncbi:MAG: DUF2062 domain-containing protein [bacterium]
MPRKLFKKYLPSPSTIRNHAHLRFLGDHLHDPNLWHLNRHSIAGAVAVGLFTAFIPFPFQMLIAAVLAIIFRVNLLLSVVLVWITNPLTVAPIFLFAYKVGVWVLGVPTGGFEFELSTHWISTELSRVWKPLLTGSLILSVSTSLLGYIATKLAWRICVIRKLRRRKFRLCEQRKKKASCEACNKEKSDNTA